MESKSALIFKSSFQIPDALFGGEERFEDRDGMRDAGGNERSGQRSVGLAIDLDARFLIQPGETIDVLPVADRFFERYAFRVGDIIGNPAAFERREPGGVADFRQPSKIGRASCRERV